MGGTPATGSVIKGAILMYSGTIDGDGYPVVDGQPNKDWALCNGGHGTTDLRNMFIKSIGDGEQPGGTGGAATHSHDNHPALAHAGAAVGNHANHVVTQPDAHPALTHTGGSVTRGTAGVTVDQHAALTHTGTGVDAHASHTHTYTQVVNHVHVQNMPSSFTGGQAYLATDTSTTGSTASPLSTANPTGGVATGTTAGPDAPLTHNVTQPSQHAAQSHTVNEPNGGQGHDHAFTQPSDHAAQSHSGGAVDAHSAHDVTQPSDHAAQSHSAASNEPAYYKLAFIQRL